MSTPRKWTKADIKRLTDTLMTFYVCNRPLDYRGWADFEPRFRAALEEHRVKIVLQGLEGNLRIARERVAQDEKTAAHFETHPNIYGESTPEMVERFRSMAAEERKAIAKVEKLMQRVKDEGLPPEVLTFDPLTHK